MTTAAAPSLSRKFEQVVLKSPDHRSKNFVQHGPIWVDLVHLDTELNQAQKCTGSIPGLAATQSKDRSFKKLFNDEVVDDARVRSLLVTIMQVYSYFLDQAARLEEVCT